ncbi:alpha/beta hydrolase-fold protein [Micromonospora sp. WMMA1949]|uniref:alpha/beta hydrolase n=1 Tax=Micromonospora sp. WMMA1949 TaxID=3015162 RepID=UPI0022B6A34E|nr:alpha/beta hydrolase-fold protein [Micromonospora sp. WMMA1949]MCZ7428747.1 alpha/beta hydrolase-fold protein [Micromonospora sp. WMMA1949]
MRYRVDAFTHDSSVLRGNRLGDPSRREVVVLSPADPPRRALPVVYLLAGFGSRGRDLLGVRPLGESLPDRLSRLVAQGVLPPVHVVLPDCATRYGGSQYLDSAMCGPYQRYLVDEVVALVDERLPTVAEAGGRAVVGKSSGGYGALMAAIQRPGVFGHVAAHTPDCGFEHTYLSLLVRALNTLRARGGIAALSRAGYAGTVDGAFMEAMSIVAMGVCYAPEVLPDIADGFPCDPRTGRFRDAVWQTWLDRDPVRLVAGAAPALATLETLYLDVGEQDEYGMQWGARALHAELTAASVPHEYDEHPYGHQGIDHRLERSLAACGAKWSA